MIETLWHRLLPGVERSKRNMFIAILMTIALLSLIASLIARYAFLEKAVGTSIHIALVAPMTGPSASTGKAMRTGIELAASRLNARGGVYGRPLVLQFLDDANNPQQADSLAQGLAKDPQIVAVVGLPEAHTAAASAGTLNAAKIPLLVPASIGTGVVKGRDYVFSTVFDVDYQTRFMANYLRNVVGEKTVSAIYVDSPEGERLTGLFDKTYRRFGTRVLNQWSYSGDLDATTQSAVEIAAQIKQKKLSGSLFLQGNATQAARVLVALRDGGVRNPVVGLSALASNAFVREVARRAAKGKTAGDYTNGMIVASPLLFDTATGVAQDFRDEFVGVTGHKPDWIAASASDTIDLIASALNTVETQRRKMAAESGIDPDGLEPLSVDKMRMAVNESLHARRSIDSAMAAVSGELYFDNEGASQTPVLAGLYNGSNLISALTQLQPITEGGVTGYLNLLKQGKVLYVNDRFMYKTNVVYTGVEMEDVTELDLDRKTAELEFLIWFRYKGKFDPADVVFENAVDEVKLENPVRASDSRKLLYRSYRVKAVFKLNFAPVQREYGTQLVGLSFHHRTLSRNNLMYVTDVLGMGLESDSTLLDRLAEGESSVSGTQHTSEVSRLQELADALGQGALGGQLLDAILKKQALAPLSGWEAIKAWVSQELLNGSSEGDPVYVGYGKPRPDFSQINYAMLLKPERIEARDFIPASWFVYVVVSCLVAVLFAIVMDRRDRGQFWRVQTLLIRMVALPLLLLAGGALLLDYAVINFTESTVDLIVLAYDSLWWLIPARLAAIAVERFLWVPLEIRTERKIPNVIRMFASSTIYLFGIFGVVAFVFDQKLTSLLATSGLLAMIIGLAVQANIANVFSGIVLNMERPFKVGDWVQVMDLPEGIVVDITWRTTRIKTRNGFIVSVPNAQVSESTMNNYSTEGIVRLTQDIHLDPRFGPEQVIPVLERALATIPEMFASKPDGSMMAEARYFGPVTLYGVDHGRYWLAYWLENYQTFVPATDAVSKAVYRELQEAGIPPGIISAPLPDHVDSDQPRLDTVPA